MRRKDREIKDFAKLVEIIDECEVIRLGLADGDYPYIVPVNFAYTVEGEQICFYIHGAMSGRKYEMMKANPVCSFEMDIPIGMDCLVDKKDVTMRYKSVMGKAKIELLTGEERQNAIDNIIMARYECTRNFEYNKPTVRATNVAKLIVTEISGKANLPNSGADI